MKSKLQSHCVKAGRRRGAILLYLMVTLPVAFGFCTLGIDASHNMLVRTELQNTADAAALAGALHMGSGMSAAISAAQTTASMNYANGATVTLSSTTDIEFLNWVSKSNYSVVTAGNYASANAIRITARRTAASNNAVTPFFGGMIGIGKSDITAVTVALYTAGTNSTINVPGTADPWLAGMPAGTTANYVNIVHAGAGPWTDSAPNNSPTVLTGQNLTAGANLQFKFSGSVSNWSGANSYNCDGDPSYVSGNWWAEDNGGSEHGMADLIAPLAGVIGIFLDDNAPNSAASGAVPSALDFTSSASRDFSSLSPLLKQPFFIGDGVRADGTTLQNFVVPAGATRLYIGVMDFQQWSDNSGSVATTVTRPISVKLVQ